MLDAASQGDPRWGQEGREGKADAIHATLELHTGQTLADAVWLDVGCGSGGIAAAIAPRASRVIGVDPEAWDRWSDFQARYRNLEFHKGSYRDLVRLLGEESIDVVVCNQVYEHVDDPVALLEAIHSVLKPAGICYFAGPNWLWPVEPHVFWPFVHWLPRRFAIRLMTVCRARRVDYLDAWSWSYWRLTRAFGDTGFRHRSVVRERVLAQAKCSGSLAARISARLPKVLYRALLPFAPGFVFALRKAGSANT